MTTIIQDDLELINRSNYQYKEGIASRAICLSKLP